MTDQEIVLFEVKSRAVGVDYPLWRVTAKPSGTSGYLEYEPTIGNGATGRVFQWIRYNCTGSFAYDWPSRIPQYIKDRLTRTVEKRLQEAAR